MAAVTQDQRYTKSAPCPVCGGFAAAPCGDLATAVERAANQLSSETYARQCHHEQCPDVAYRRGWNDGTKRAVLLLRALLAQHRLNVALHELRASDVDALFDQTETSP